MSDLRPTPPPIPAPAEAEPRAGHLAFVAHEIRNPLSTALWCVEMLTRMSSEERGGARGEKLSRMSLRALGRLRRLIEDHLLSERIDAGGLSIDLEEVPARELFPDAAAVGASCLELELQSGLSVVVEPALARRVCEAVLLAAARGGAEVRVSGTRRGKVARFRVEGAPATPEQLGDPRRGDIGDTRGAALALPTARRSCQLLGGSIRVEQGAWVLDLPAAQAPRQQG